jgi:hypothetical protein
MVRSIWGEMFNMWLRPVEDSKDGVPDTDGSDSPSTTRLRAPIGKEHALDVPFNVLRQVFQREKEAGELLQTLNEVIGHGFELNKRNWNRSIQLLACGGYWKEAFLLCETVLMPNWDGWRFMRARAIQNIRDQSRGAYERQQRSDRRKRRHPQVDKTKMSRGRLSRVGFAQRRSFSTSPRRLMARQPSSNRHDQTRVSAANHHRKKSGPVSKLRWLRRRRLLRALEKGQRASRAWFGRIRPIAQWYFQYIWYNRKVRRWHQFRKEMGTSPRLRPEITQPTRHPAYLMPLPHTLLTLGSFYVKLSKAHWWDEGASEALRTIRQMCPRTVAAIHELRYHPHPKVQQTFATNVLEYAPLRYDHRWTDPSNRASIRQKVIPAYWMARKRYHVLELLRAWQNRAVRREASMPHKGARATRPNLLRSLYKLRRSKLRQALLWRRRSKMADIARTAKEAAVTGKKSLTHADKLRQLLGNLTSSRTANADKEAPSKGAAWKADDEWMAFGGEDDDTKEEAPGHRQVSEFDMYKEPEPEEVVEDEDDESYGADDHDNRGSRGSRGSRRRSHWQ